MGQQLDWIQRVQPHLAEVGSEQRDARQVRVGEVCAFHRPLGVKLLREVAVGVVVVVARERGAPSGRVGSRHRQGRFTSSPDSHALDDSLFNTTTTLYAHDTPAAAF
jgi:hypothetical protein